MFNQVITNFTIKLGGVYYVILVLLLSISSNTLVNSQEINQSIIIHNVTFVDPDGEKENIVATLVIKNKMFDLITNDPIEVAHTDIVYDAQKGFLVGALKPGKSANIMILDENPYEDSDVLLDTKKHILLAVRKGIVIRNNLKSESNIPASVAQKPTKARSKGWLAYAPPPVAIPSNYKNADWINFENDYFTSVLIGMLALDRQNWKSQNNDSELQLGDLQSYDGGEIRGLRFGVAGAIKFDKPWVYMISGATNAFDKGFDTNTTDNVSFFDWRIDIPTFADTTLSIGKQKEPISMERSIGMVFLPMQERSVVSDALLASRNVGAVLSGTAINNKLTWAGGVFNDWLDSEGSISENSTQLVGRTTWLPYLSDDENEIVHLGFGLRYSDTKESVRFATEPEFNQSPLFVDTGEINADSSLTYNLEAAWRKGPLWLVGEYTENQIDADYLDNPSLAGYHVSAVWSVTGEMRGYNKKSGTFSPMPVSRSVSQGGWGALEVSSRWSVFDGSNAGLQAGDTSILSLGASWWLSPKFNVNVNYRWINLERCSFLNEQCELEGKSHGFNTRIALFL
ncbi:OprO/OprP family phosphate-selective porin [Litorilituus lipolyticus]|uniref:Porin n=1 Tax=Litorilituus lipolyticus TaxID=2491017 RepID=A0A502L2A6_9GAMM|nr:porin [Litorilituus lipolyticus]TPH18100.1 hypothetical protein EPA86_03005 [Litorilituus lipolyticus]